MPFRRLRRLVLRLVAVALAVVVVYVGGTFVEVWLASRRDDARPADAIVVLGAAQYDGRPSPVLRARLDHAAELYRAGLADIVVVTGGRRAGDRYTEATAGYAYLRRAGVPDAALRKEVSGTNSWESLAATSRFLRAEDAEEVVLVSDPYHSRRLRAIAEELGLHAHVSPTRTSPVDGAAELRALARETVAVSVGRLVGYRRLMRLDEAVAGVRNPIFRG